MAVIDISSVRVKLKPFWQPLKPPKLPKPIPAALMMSSAWCKGVTMVVLPDVLTVYRLSVPVALRKPKQ